MNDPLGTAANILTDVLDGDGTAARKNDSTYSSDDAGEFIAQLPHIVDLSIGYTVINKAGSSSTAQHFGVGSNSRFFEGWKTTAARNANDSNPGVRDLLGGEVADALDWAGVDLF